MTTDHHLAVPPRRSLVRYHGGKWRLAPWIIAQFPPHRFYVEPFGGGGSVLLRKPRSYAEIYNDLDGEIVNLFRVVRDRGAEIVRAIALTPFSREDFRESYEPTADAVERARRTLIRSHMGFGTAASRMTADGRTQSTGFRSSAKRSGTTPATNWYNLPDGVAAVVDRLRGVVIENRDAMVVMARHDGPETLHYVDPPYVHSTRSDGSINCYRHEMTDAQHVELAQFLHMLKGAVIVSGYDCDLYRELFHGWDRRQIDTHGDGARDRTEVLWLRNCETWLFKQTTNES
jgi:DNA adenine methylase